MVKLCCVAICGSRSPDPSGTKRTLFKVPKDAVEGKKWMAELAPHLRKGKNSRKTLYVCDRHFRDEDILRDFCVKLNDGLICNVGARGLLRLKPSSVPCIFKFQLNGEKCAKESREDPQSTNEIPSSVPCIFKFRLNGEKSANESREGPQSTNEIPPNIVTEVIYIEEQQEYNTSYFSIETLENDLTELGYLNMPEHWSYNKIPMGLSLCYFGDEFTYPTRSIFISKKLTVEIRLLDRIANVDLPTEATSLEDVLSMMKNVSELNICPGIDNETPCPNCFFKQLSKSLRCDDCKVERKRLIDRQLKRAKRS